MKNKITDLNNHLFAQLERLGEEKISEKNLEKEIDRSKAIVQISSQLIKSASLQLKAAEIMHQSKTMNVPEEFKSLEG